MDMYNVTPPSTPSGLSDLAVLAALFQTKDGVSDMLQKLSEYSVNANAAYEQARAAIKEAKLLKEQAEAVEKDAMDSARSIAKRIADLEEAERTFNDYKNASLDELSVEQEQLAEDRKRMAEKEDRLDNELSIVADKKAAMEKQMAEFLAEKEAFRQKVEAVKNVGL